MESFKSNIAEMDLTTIKKNIDTDSGWFMTWKGENEYLVEVEGLEIEAIRNTFSVIVKDAGFTILKSPNNNSVIIAERGLFYLDPKSTYSHGLGVGSNEWNMIAGIYIFDDLPLYTVYVRVQITQDVTGGFGVNRAKNLIEVFCEIRKGNCVNHTDISGATN
jgi:hypothetical protein